MNRKAVWIAILTVAVVVISYNAVWAGGQEGQAPSADDLLGPEIWAVLVVDCLQDQLIVRAKEIDNCIVNTEAVIVDIASICQSVTEPLEAVDMIGEQYPGLELFGNTGKTPVIMKVKNFQQTGDLYSFDALVNFVQ